MMMRMGIAYLLCITAFLAVAQAGPDPLGGTGGGPINGTLHVRVVHDGTTDPVAGAFVMVGPAPGSPFPGNHGFASANGEITFTHANLSGPVMVTAGSAGLAYFTVAGVDANDVVLPLKPVSSSAMTYEVGDKVSGIDVDNGFLNSGDGNVDVAFVMPALTLADLMSFDMASLMGPMETMNVMGQTFLVPTNLYVPNQYELFQQITKDHYYLYLPAGDHTITALSGRVGLQDLLNSTEIIDLIPLLNWREIDVIDVTVTGNTYTADLNVDPDMNKTVTMNLANLPEGATAWCLSMGDLDALNGLGRLLTLGLNTIEIPASGAGSAQLTTTAATGKFAGMDFFPVAAVQFGTDNDLLVVTDRASHGQTYTAALSTFFKRLDLSHVYGILSWNDVENPAANSPEVHLQTARITNAPGSVLYWELMVRGDRSKVMVPFLPPQAPGGLNVGGTYGWEQLAFGLDFNLASFDFDDFAFSDITQHGSHMAIDSTQITWPRRKYAPRSPSIHK